MALGVSVMHRILDHGPMDEIRTGGNPSLKRKSLITEGSRCVIKGYEFHER